MDGKEAAPSNLGSHSSASSKSVNTYITRRLNPVRLFQSDTILPTEVDGPPRSFPGVHECDGDGEDESVIHVYVNDDDKYARFDFSSVCVCAQVLSYLPKGSRGVIGFRSF